MRAAAWFLGFTGCVGAAGVIETPENTATPPEGSLAQPGDDDGGDDPGPSTSASTTPPTGDQVPASRVDGRVFSIDLGQATFVQPVGLELLLADLFTSFVLLQLDAKGEDAFQGLLALSLPEEPVQDLCTETVLLDFDYAQNPRFNLASDSLDLSVAGFRFQLSEARLDGTFNEDATAFDRGHLAGLLDTRDLGDALGIPGGAGALCLVVATLGVSCEACSDGEELCLVLEVEDVAGDHLPDATLEVRTADDVAADCG